MATRAIFDLDTNSTNDEHGNLIRNVSNNVATLLAVQPDEIVTSEAHSGSRRLEDEITKLVVSMPILESSRFTALVSILDQSTSLPFLQSNVDPGIVSYGPVRYKTNVKEDLDMQPWLIALIVTLSVLFVAGATTAAYLLVWRVRPKTPTKQADKTAREGEGTGLLDDVNQQQQQQQAAHTRRLPTILIAGDKKPLLSDF